jgi:hypothetical protein
LVFTATCHHIVSGTVTITTRITAAGQLITGRVNVIIPQHSAWAEKQKKSLYANPFNQL